MKFSITLSVIILIVAAAFAWRDQQRLGSIRNTYDKLAAEATSLGITPAVTASERTQRPDRPDRPDQAAAAKALATDYMGRYRQLLTSDLLDEKAKADLYEQRNEILEKISKLSATQMKIVMAELRAATGFDGLWKKQMISNALSAIADTQPRTALEFMMESPDPNVEIGGMFQDIKREALTNWAKEDPLGAFDWLRANKKTHPDRINDLDIFFPVARQVSTPEQRAIVYSAVRDRATDPNERPRSAEFVGRVIRELAFSAGGSLSGFEEASAWIESAQLSEKEFEVATDAIYLRLNPKENGKWIEWMGKSGMSEKLAKKRIAEIAEDWTERDYRAIGKWLSTAPDSLGKSTAVATYATTVYDYDPDNAMQWLQTLLQGPDRSKALETIHQTMPKDSDQAKAFAIEHGLNK